MVIYYIYSILVRYRIILAMLLANNSSKTDTTYVNKHGF